MLCSPSQSNLLVLDGPTGNIYVAGNTGFWTRDTETARFTCSVTLTGEATRPPDEATLFLLAAYSLLQVMPQSGLEESYRVLNEIFEYHSFRPLAILPAPTLPRMKAKLRPAIKQNGFQIEAE